MECVCREDDLAMDEGKEKIERPTLARPSSGSGEAASSSGAPARHKARGETIGQREDIRTSLPRTRWHLSLQTGLACSVRTIENHRDRSTTKQVVPNGREGKENELRWLLTQHDKRRRPEEAYQTGAGGRGGAESRRNTQ